MNEQATTHAARITPAPTFSPGEWRRLRALRIYYEQYRDLFTAREIAGLRFLRWLYDTGRVVP